MTTQIAAFLSGLQPCIHLQLKAHLTSERMTDLQLLTTHAENVEMVSIHCELLQQRARDFADTAC